MLSIDSHYSEYYIFIDMLSVGMLSVGILSVIMLSLAMLRVIEAEDMPQFTNVEIFIGLASLSQEPIL
jgi:hypothetical protein